MISKANIFFINCYPGPSLNLCIVAVVNVLGSSLVLICSFVSPPSSLWQTYTTSWLLFSQIVTLLAQWVGQLVIAHTKLPIKLFILWIELGGKPNQCPSNFLCHAVRCTAPVISTLAYCMNFQKNANLHLTHHMIEIGASGNYKCNCCLWWFSPGRL